MSYTLLKDLYYKDSQKHHSLYKERFESPYAHHINFNIGDSPAFFVITPEIQSKMLKIQRFDKKVFPFRRNCRKKPSSIFLHAV